jgi:signal transduction histidine kinase
MNERMQQLGGKLEVFSSRNGTTVMARIPCQVSEVTTSTA